MGDRAAELAKGQYEVSDPGKGGGAQLFNSGDAATDLAHQLLETAKTPEDIAAAMKFAPGYVRAIVLVAQKKFGNAAVEQALYLSQTGDHTAGVKNRELLSTGAVNATDTTAPDANKKLPFTDTGWDAVAINTALGQYDKIAGTDSDGARCAFAVGLAAHIFKGPSATASFALNYLMEIEKEVEAKGGKLSPRQIAAQDVIGGAAGAIASKEATYGDLAWMQEGLHDMTLADDRGAPKSTQGLMNADVTSKDQFVNITCMSAADVVSKAKELQDGEQYMCEWVFPVASTGADGESQGKHEMLIANHGGVLYLYDSEKQGDGQHLRPLDGTTLARYFKREDSWITLAIKLFPAPKKAEVAGGAKAPKKGK